MSTSTHCIYFGTHYTWDWYKCNLKNTLTNTGKCRYCEEVLDKKKVRKQKLKTINKQ